MSRKATITQKEIVNAAFKITKKEGFNEITSRRLAAVAGCSTQPIFRIYENMDALKKDIYDKTADYFDDYYKNFPKEHETPFVDFGLAYVNFARKNPHLFELLFLSNGGEDAKSTYDLVNGSDDFVVKEIGRARDQGAASPEHVFMKMWIFIHGAASMAYTGDYDLGDEETVDMFTSAYNSFAK